LEAIENKIEKARKKMEEHKKEKSKVAIDTRYKVEKGGSNSIDDDGMDGFLYQ
jgi:hypothetical protein